MKWCVALFFIFLSVHAVFGDECFLCKNNGFACISETQRAPCDLSAVPPFNFDAIETCAERCANGQCVERSITPTCIVCNECRAGNHFACASKFSYRKCPQDDDVPLLCDPGLECFPDNVGSPCSMPPPLPQVQRQCFPVAPAIPPTTAAPSTQAPTTDPISPEDNFCRQKRLRGNYESLRKNDCTEFIFCSLVSGQWKGEYRACGTGLIFNAAVGFCQNSKFIACRPL